VGCAEPDLSSARQNVSPACTPESVSVHDGYLPHIPDITGDHTHRYWIEWRRLQPDGTYANEMRRMDKITLAQETIWCGPTDWDVEQVLFDNVHAYLAITRSEPD